MRRIGVDLMKTKQEYIDALERMEQAYYNFDGCMSSMNKFKEDINLLTGLVNEHFEENAETNLNHYFNDLLKVGNRFTFMNEKIENCNSVMCSKCVFEGDCGIKRFKWLASPYKPVYKLTKFEKKLLQCYSDIYSFKVFNSLNGMKEKGYFKGIDDNETIGDILGNCEVIK